MIITISLQPWKCVVWSDIFISDNLMSDKTAFDHLGFLFWELVLSFFLLTILCIIFISLFFCGLWLYYLKKPSLNLKGLNYFYLNLLSLLFFIYKIRVINTFYLTNTQVVVRLQFLNTQYFKFYHKYYYSFRIFL